MNREVSTNFVDGTSPEEKTCLICMKPLQKTQSSISRSESLEELSSLFQVLCKYMNWDMAVDFDKEPFPFCKECKVSIVGLFKLHQQLEEIQKQINQVTVGISLKVLQSQNVCNIVKEERNGDEVEERSERRAEGDVDECPARDQIEDYSKGMLVSEVNSSTTSPSATCRNNRGSGMDEPESILPDEEDHDQPPVKKRKYLSQLRTYPKPGFSYTCLIALALKNSKRGFLLVGRMYEFICDHFPYYNSIPVGWKNGLRHCLSKNKKFFQNVTRGSTRTRFWKINELHSLRIDENIQDCLGKNYDAILNAMSDPENLELILMGELKRDYGSDNDEEEERFVSKGDIQAQRPSQVLMSTNYLIFRQNPTETQCPKGAGTVSKSHSSDSSGKTSISSTSVATTISQSVFPRVYGRKE